MLTGMTKTSAGGTDASAGETDASAGSGDRISPEQFHEVEGVDGWRVLGEEACAYFHTGSFATGARLVEAIGDLAGIDERPPEIDLRRDAVTVRLSTIEIDSYDLTRRDVELVRQISAVAREMGLSADPSAVATIHLGIDALVVPEVLPFWQAVLGYRDRGEGTTNIIDPRDHGPLIFFQQMAAERPQRNRIHVDVWVPHDQAEARVAEAISAGGHLVTDRYVPSWWVLADAEGNEACVCTWRNPPLDPR